VCDDLRVTVEGDRIVQTERACQLAEPWFREVDRHAPPVAEIESVPVEFDTALNRAAEILARSDAPLIYGLSRSSTPGQQSAVALADRLGATIDSTASRCHAPSIRAFQTVGESTCTLGEIRNRADLVIYWGSNPVASHPRHFERYSLDPIGEFVPEGRAGRFLVVVDVERTASANQADLFLQVDPDRDFEALWTLRLLVAGGLPAPGAETGAPLAQLEELASRMRACQCGVIFFGLGLTRSRLGHRNVEALLTLVRDLNDHTRFHARRMRIQGDVAGADSVLCWQTGYPFSVNLGPGYPRFNPGEFSANELLERGEVDACLLVGSEGVEWLSPAARERLAELPVIALDYPHLTSRVPPTVRFTTAVYGVHAVGTAYRMDEVPLPLKAFLPTTYPTDAQVLNLLAEELARRLD
jgi:formylmethanofuran dehydrogenase subunit B